MFINESTLIQATGYTYAAYQKKWCRENGLPYKLNGKGELNILIEDYIKKFGLKNNKLSIREQEPEFEAIRDKNGKKATKKQAPATKGAV